MKNCTRGYIYLFLLPAVFLFSFFFACSAVNNLPPRQISTCKASSCHPSNPLLQFPPETGKHAIHLAKSSICENCHYDYNDNPRHKNGILDKSQESTIVYFDGMNPRALWNTTSVDCSNLNCHGPGSSAANWYSDAPARCEVCHSPGSAIDPLITNGSGITGKHMSHAVTQNIGCEICHYEYKKDPRHINAIYGKNESGTIINISGSFNNLMVSFTFNKSTGLCGTISCHGNPGTMNWYGDGNGCSDCHTPGSAIDPLTTSGAGTGGKHSAHISKGIECVICHNNYKAQPTHMNGMYGKAETSTIISAGGSYNGVAVNYLFNDTDGKCGNISCHGNSGGVTWYDASKPACTTCHAPGSSIDPLATGGSGSSGKHSAHAAAGCQVCHESYGSDMRHINGSKETVSITSFDSDGSQGSSWGNVSAILSEPGICGSISCHGGGSADWYSTGNLACMACHTGSLAPGGTGSSGKHTVHLAIGCEVCHETYTNDARHGNGSNETISITSFDVNGSQGSLWGNVTVAFSEPGTCASISCHGGGSSPADWFSASVSCSICHSTVTAMPSDDRHIKHVTEKGYACPTCHEGRGPGTSYHANGAKDVYISGGGSYTSPTCSGVSCHGSVTGTGAPRWTDSGPLACTDCHLGNLMPGDTGTKGKHDYHGPSKNMVCEVCHENYRADVKHANGLKETASITSFDSDGSHGSSWGNVTTTVTEPGTCSSISCHGGGSADWYSSGTLACSACHIGSLTPGETGAAGKHTAHMAVGCEVCHENYRENSNHGKGSLNTTAITFFDTNGSQGSPWGNVTATLSEPGRCASISCHGGGSSPAEWFSTTALACNNCHGDANGLPATGAHGKHAAGGIGNKSYACATCHEGRGPGTMYHANGIKDVNIQGGGTCTNSTCSGVACHGSVSGPGAPEWTGSGPLACAACHTGTLAPGGTSLAGKHTSHVTIRNIGCEVCHENYRSDSKHADGTKNSASITAFDTNGSQGSSWGSVTVIFSEPGFCSSISCHSGTNAYWYSTKTLACTTCHSYLPSDAHSDAHFSDYGIPCNDSRCHGNYLSDPAHMNHNYNPAPISCSVGFCHYP